MAKHCLVTGANRGIGLAFVHKLLARGDRVIAACRHPGKATALNTLTGEYPGRLHVLPLDVADAKAREELVRELPLVCEHIDLLLNNAGVLHSGERFGSLSDAHLDDSFRTNVVGPLLLTQALAPLLADAAADRQGARVVNISSQLGSIARTTRFGTPSYNISKAALNMATVLLSQALAERGIVVVAMHPGWVRTDMGGKDAHLEPAASVAGILEVAGKLDTTDSGRFLDWQGEPLPW